MGWDKMDREAEIIKIKSRIEALNKEYETLINKLYKPGCEYSKRAFQFIKDNKDNHKIEVMAKTLKVSRSGYYAWLKRAESKRAIFNKKLLSYVREIHEASGGKFGAVRITRALKERGIVCCDSKIGKLMRKHNIRVKINKQTNKEER